MTRLGRFAAASVFTLILTGCGGSDEPAEESAPETTDSSSSSSPTESPSDTEAASCPDLFTDKQAAELVGSDVGTAEEAEVEGLPACQWGSPNTGVQVIALPADEWIAQLPALIDALEQSGLSISPDQQQRLDEGRELISGGADASPDEACELFSTLAEVQGMPSGSDSVTNLFPNQEQPEVVSAQAYTDGRFTSVTFGSPDLRKDVDAAVAAVEDALSTVQENAGG